MSSLDLVLWVSLLGGDLLWLRQAAAEPPQELLENLEFLEDMPVLEDVDEEDEP